MTAPPSASELLMVSREEYLKPHFEVAQTIPLETILDMDRIKFCAESDECDLEEMSQMLRELERLNSECMKAGKATNSECNVQLQVTREMYMDELGYHMELAMEKSKLGQSQENHIQGENVSSHGATMADHLQRLHEIAEYEEH